MSDVQDGKPFTLDTTDVDRFVGKPLPTVQLSDPVTVGDIRRWAQGMQYPNPLHYDADAAAVGPFGAIIAPQSFSVACDIGHGASPSIVGKVPGSHMIFGGDEWWFSGVRVYPGDHLRQRRWFVDYKIADTKFAGPTNLATAMINFPSLAAYEQYRERLSRDPESVENLRRAEESGCILVEDRAFLERV